MSHKQPTPPPDDWGDKPPTSPPPPPKKYPIDRAMLDRSWIICDVTSIYDMVVDTQLELPRLKLRPTQIQPDIRRPDIADVILALALVGVIFAAGFIVGLWIKS